MDVSGVSTADGAQITQWAATGGNNQKWQAVDAGNGAVYLQGGAQRQVRSRSPAAPPRRAPSSSRPPATTATSRSSPPPPTGTSGVYTVKSVLSGLCVDVNGAATTDGARLLQWTCHSGSQPAVAVHRGVTARRSRYDDVPVGTGLQERQRSRPGRRP